MPPGLLWIFLVLGGGEGLRTRISRSAGDLSAADVSKSLYCASEAEKTPKVMRENKKILMTALGDRIESTGVQNIFNNSGDTLLWTNWRQTSTFVARQGKSHRPITAGVVIHFCLLLSWMPKSSIGVFFFGLIGSINIAYKKENIHSFFIDICGFHLLLSYDWGGFGGVSVHTGSVLLTELLNICPKNFIPLIPPGIEDRIMQSRHIICRTANRTVSAVL